MKIQLTFKTPDVADGVLEGLSAAEATKAEKLIAKYVEYGEYATIELDLETGEATVLPVKS